MNITKLKAAIFDAEQALTWARQAIDDGDAEAAEEALNTAAAQCTEARLAIRLGADYSLRAIKPEPESGS